MSDPFGEAREGFLARLFRGKHRAVIKTTVRRTEQLTLACPSDKAEVVREAVEQWLHDNGVDAAVSTDEHQPGKSRIHAKLSAAETAKVDLSSESVQAELQEVLFTALGK
jgi:hypothetical protein